MKDMRAEYKKKFEAATKQEDQFREFECNECGIWALFDHKSEGGYCKYLIRPEVKIGEHYDEYGDKVITPPLIITVKNVSCMLFDNPKQV